jgi:hypothetical protein
LFPGLSGLPAEFAATPDHRSADSNAAVVLKQAEQTDSQAMRGVSYGEP